MDNYQISNFNIAVFSDLTGVELTEEELPKFERAYRRAVLFLEEQLGWSFNYVSPYHEIGISKKECQCVEGLDTMTNYQRNKYITEADTPQGQTKLFNYNLEDTNFFIDPATAVYSVKLVYPLKGPSQQFVTLKKLEYTMPRVISPRHDLIRYIERCNSWPCDICGCNCAGCALLAVDASWLDEAPDAMIDLLCQLVLYYMKHPYSMDIVKEIKSESVDGHSVSYGTEEYSLDDITKTPGFMSIINNYKGPYSPFTRKLKVN